LKQEFTDALNKNEMEWIFGQNFKIWTNSLLSVFR
jgi:hypothetical protein